MTLFFKLFLILLLDQVDNLFILVNVFSRPLVEVLNYALELYSNGMQVLSISLLNQEIKISIELKINFLYIKNQYLKLLKILIVLMAGFSGQITKLLPLYLCEIEQVYYVFLNLLIVCGIGLYFHVKAVSIEFLIDGKYLSGSGLLLK